MNTQTGYGRGSAPRRLGLALITGALGAAVVALASPAAAEPAVTRLGATPDTNFGMATNYGTGCNYTLQAFVSDPSAPVVFYDNGEILGVAKPTGAYAVFPWVPATPGRHTLAAVQSGQPADLPPATLDLPVGFGVHLGYGCNVFGG
ncbi:hypothetical protein [Nocardia terpenica]|uniref:Ig-like domain repeat protein n=1 Tax=Nocardia terpenica TaxID=455432 RepID=A0A6G9YZ30_9NOCA|nr:hypothetical protein [Nocardia terpenica]QIS18599.1 hypothetical protein F6W96_10125 [Nocardia terpenica]